MAHPTKQPVPAPGRPDSAETTRKAQLAAAVVFLVIALLLETGARLIPQGEDNLTSITRILDPDPRLFWVHKPNLQTTFAASRFSTNSLGFRGLAPETPKNKLRIVVMGASPAMGWGVEEEESYPGILSALLNNEKRGVEVLNASVIGYTSFQGLALFRDAIARLAPDIVIFAYGVNDPDKYRFFMDSDLSDKEVRPPAGFFLAVERGIRASRALSLCAMAIRKLTAAQPVAGPARRPRKNRRVSQEDFASNLETLVLEAREAGAKVILATNPFLLPAKTGRPQPEARKNADSLAAGYESSCATGNCDASLLEKALKLDPWNPRALFSLAAAASGPEKAGIRKKMFLSEMEECLTLVGQYNHAVRKLAKELAVPLCDLETLFSPAKKANPDYFLAPGKDMVHFSPKGHRTAANALIPIVRKIVQ